MKLIFVTGKGGVGKSTVASAVALSRAELGQEVLLVEFGPKSYLSHVFELKSNDKTNSVKIRPPKNLKIEMWNFQEVLVEFVAYYLKLKILVRKFFTSPVMQKLIKVAPSLRDLVYLGKATSAYRKIGEKMDYDVIIIDAYSTGHFLALLRSPIGMMEAVKKGMMHDQCKTILKVLKNPDQVEYYVVSLAEKLPVIETNEFIEVLKQEFSISPQVILNKVKKKLVGEINEKCLFQTIYSSETDNQLSNINKLNEHSIKKKLPFIYKNNAADVIDSVKGLLG